MFSNNNIPCVGASIGIERVFAILEDKYKKANVVLREN
jgi:histidyl-tRNA synthetase